MRRWSAVMGAAPFRPRFVRASIDHLVQVMRGFFDVEVLVLARSAFGGDYSATVDLFEIAVRELIVPFGVFGPRVVDAQIPFPVLFKSMPLDEVILLLR
jgi:hypothetical protein